MNAPVVSAGRIFGAMPPPMNTPPVATVRSAKLPGLGAVGFDEDAQRLDAAGAASGQGRRRDRRRRAGGIEIDRRLTRAGVDGAVDVQQAAPRDHVFDLRAPVARDECLQQRDLAFRARREVGVAAF